MSLASCLALGAVIFAIGIYGLLTRRSMIAMLLAIELAVAAAIINVMAFVRFGGSTVDAEAGILFPLFVIALTACEMALALALVVAVHREQRHVDAVQLGDLHG